MQLVKIEHSRCGDSAGATFMWAPEDKTEAQFHNDCLEAQDALLTAEQVWKVRKGTPHHLYMGAPDMQFLLEHIGDAVGAMLAAWDRRKEEARAVEEAANAARRGFAEHMHDRGYLYLFELDPPLTELLGWGHNHGLKIKLDDNADNEPSSADLLGQDNDYPRYRKI